jgi:hypothetical protein
MHQCLSGSPIPQNALSSHPSHDTGILAGLIVTSSVTVLLLALILSWKIRRLRQGSVSKLNPSTVMLPQHSGDDMTEVGSSRHTISSTSECIAGSATNSCPTSTSDTITEAVASLILQHSESRNDTADAATIPLTSQLRVPGVSTEELREIVREEIARAMSRTRLPNGVVSRNTSVTSSPPPSYHTRRSQF